MRHALACLVFAPLLAAAHWLVVLLLSRAGPHAELLTYVEAVSVLSDVYLDCRFASVVLFPRVGRSNFSFVTLNGAAVALHAGLLPWLLLPDVRGIRVVLTFVLVCLFASLCVFAMLLDKSRAWASYMRTRAELEPT